MDRRVRKTKQTLKETLINIMNYKQYRNISITELAEAADINRGTFYIHYSDIYELIQEIENDIIEKIKIIIHKHIHNQDYEKMVYEIIIFVKKDKKLFQNLMGENGDIGFINRIKGEMKKVFIDSNNLIPKNENERFYYDNLASFIVSGGIGIFQDWLDNDCRDPIQNLVKSFYITFNNIINK